MGYEFQKQIQRELDARIPRGLSGGPQNELRFGFYFYRSQGLSFENSLAPALGGVRERHPNFVPKILPLLTR